MIKLVRRKKYMLFFLEEVNSVSCYILYLRLNKIVLLITIISYKLVCSNEFFRALKASSLPNFPLFPTTFLRIFYPSLSGNEITFVPLIY